MMRTQHPKGLKKDPITRDLLISWSYFNKSIITLFLSNNSPTNKKFPRDLFDIVIIDETTFGFLLEMIKYVQ